MVDPGRSQQDEERRVAVIQIALEQIAEGGVFAIDDRSRLARAVGCAEAELDELFSDRSELLRAALRFRVDKQIKRFSALAAGMRRNPPSLENAAGVVEGIIWGAVEQTEELAELEIHLQAARDPALQKETRRAFAAYEEFAGAVLGALGLPTTPEATRLAVVLFTGLALSRLSTGESEARGTYEALIVLARGLQS